MLGAEEALRWRLGGVRLRGVGEPFAPLRERWRVPVMSDKSVKALLQEDVKEEIAEFEKDKRMNH